MQKKLETGLIDLRLIKDAALKMFQELAPLPEHTLRGDFVSECWTQAVIDELYRKNILNDHIELREKL